MRKKILSSLIAVSVISGVFAVPNSIAVPASISDRLVSIAENECSAADESLWQTVLDAGNTAEILNGNLVITGNGGGRAVAAWYPEISGTCYIETKLKVTGNYSRIFIYNNSNQQTAYVDVYEDRIKYNGRYSDISYESGDYVTFGLYLKAEDNTVDIYVDDELKYSGMQTIENNSENVIYDACKCVQIRSVSDAVTSTITTVDYVHIYVEQDTDNILFSQQSGGYSDTSKLNETLEYGVCGKALDDQSSKWVGRSSRDGYTDKLNDGNFMLAKLNFYNKSKKYFVIEANINPIKGDAEISSVSVHTDSHRKVSGETSIDKFNMGQWNKYLMYVDMDTYNAYTYVNGVLTAESECVDGFGTTYSQMRLCFNGTRDTNMAVYIDDVTIYETNETPDAAAITGVPKANQSPMYIKSADRIMAKSNTTVTEVKAANTDYTARIYTDNTFKNYAEDSVVVESGMVLALENTATHTVGLYNFVSSIPQSIKAVANAATRAYDGKELEDVSSGIYGNTSDNIKKFCERSGDDNRSAFINHSYEGLSEDANYLVYEVDFCPSSGISACSFGTNKNMPLSDRIAIGQELELDKWHKLIMVYDVANDTSDTYVNGVCVFESYEGSYAESFEQNPSELHLRFIIEGYNDDELTSYIGDYKIYETVIYPEIPVSANIESGYNEEISGYVDNVSRVAYISNGTRISDISVNDAQLCVLNGAYAAEGIIAEGNDICIINSGGNFAYYKINLIGTNDLVLLGDNYNAGTSIIYPGTVTVHKTVTGKAAVAQYDRNGRMVKVKISEDGADSVSFAPDNIEHSTVSAMLVNDFDELIPLCDSKQASYAKKQNILFVGNSFSMDVTHYMRDIAAAAGLDYDIYVLNKGGSKVSYHYNNREIPIEQSDLHLWKNGILRGCTNLKTLLDNYDWDYVVMQNWGGSASFYSNTDENYTANWADMINLAKYIHEKEPNAELAIHETWSFESGYKDFTDKSVRDAATNSIRALYSRCAEDIKSELDLPYDVKMISSGDAFAAARNYQSSDNIYVFDTEYNMSKHQFERLYVNINDGSSMLSDEDAAVGRVSLHRDGFHASMAARYLIALNAVQTISGKSVYGNSYRPAGFTADSATSNMTTDADMSSASGVVQLTFAPLSENIVVAMQTIAESIR